MIVFRFAWPTLNKKFKKRGVLVFIQFIGQAMLKCIRKWFECPADGGGGEWVLRLQQSPLPPLWINASIEGHSVGCAGRSGRGRARSVSPGPRSHSHTRTASHHRPVLSQPPSVTTPVREGMLEVRPAARPRPRPRPAPRPCALAW